MTTGKAILIVGGVGVGAFVLLQLLKPRASAPAATGAPKANTDIVFATGLLNFGSSLVNAYSSRNKSNPNEGIDPSTGGVYLPEGKVYGP